MPTPVIVLGGCNSTDRVELSELSAEDRCLRLAARHLGLSDTGVDLVDDSSAASAPPFRLVSTGQFVAEIKAVEFPGFDHAIDISCTGDFNRRQIASLQIDGTISRPAKPDEWAFE